MGISPDASVLIEYEEIGWFLNEAFKIKEKETVESMLKMSEALRMAFIGSNSKKGFDQYQKWYRDLKNKITDNPGKSGEGKTLFDNLKESPKLKKVKTLFKRLKG